MTECTFCGKAVDPNIRGNYVEQTGWSVTRSAGGLNQLSLRKETGRYAHGACIRLAVRGVDPRGQEAML